LKPRSSSVLKLLRKLHQFTPNYHNPKRKKKLRNLLRRHRFKLKSRKQVQKTKFGPKHLHKFPDLYTKVVMKRMNGLRSCSLILNSTKRKRKWKNWGSKSRKRRWEKIFRGRFRRKTALKSRIWQMNWTIKNFRWFIWIVMTSESLQSLRIWRTNSIRKSFLEISSFVMRIWERSRTNRKKEILIKEWSSRLNESF